MRFILIVIVVFSALASCFYLQTYAAGNVFYVSPSGIDTNPGTQEQPLKTLLQAYNKVTAGDTIYLRGGTYTITAGIKLSKSGISGNPIKIFAFQGEVPILDGIGMTSEGVIITLSNASWHHIKGLEIKNSSGNGVELTNASNNNIIEALHVHHSGRLSQFEGKGIALFGSGSNNLFLNNDSHHNRDIQGDDADGFQISTTGSGTVLRGNRAWRNSDDGYDFFNVQNNTQGGTYILENNYAWENGYDDNLQALGDGNGFKLGGLRANTTSTSGGHTLKNNVAWKNKATGFDENSANKPLTLYNNTGFNNVGRNFSFWTTPHTFKNNLSVGGLVNITGGATGSTMNNNSWNLSVTANTADFASIDETAAKGPRNADGSLPNATFLRLVAGSDLIDKGVPVGIPYTGSAPDLGAYEFGATTSPTGIISPTQIPVSPTGSVTEKQVTVIVFLHGIGKGGDNVNPQSTGNPNPLRPQRTLTLELYNANNQFVASKSGIVQYNATDGNFQGSINAGSLPQGAYTARVKMEQYLKKSIPGILSITAAPTVAISSIAVIAGDVNNDNLISILDYNMLLDCFSDLSPARNCSDLNKKQMTDLTDDGNVNQFDYNLFLRELSVQSGQ